MAYFKEVSPGDGWRPQASKENAVAKLLNQMSAMCAGGVTGGGAVRKLSAPVYNTTLAVLTYGSPVAINSGATAADDGEILPVRAATSSDEAWGILLSQLGVGETGEMLLIGVFTIPIDLVLGTAAAYVKPDGAGGYIYSSSGSCRVLGETADGGIVVQHGAAAAASNETYFKLEHRVELIESGGVQVETHYVDITNPGYVYAFGRNFLAPSGTVEVDASATTDIFAQVGYISGGTRADRMQYVTSASPMSATHPAIKLGYCVNGSAYQVLNINHAPYQFHRPSDKHLAVPIISGGVQCVKVPSLATDIGSAASRTFLEPDSGSGFLMIRAISSGDSAVIASGGFVLETSATAIAANGGYMYVGDIGKDPVPPNRIEFGAKYFI
ncbi:MAG: hypothetical protein PHI85_04905 [Victivallaceae bacterium]|nr:hypothetical protein [Victivallaceae bacterium]